MQEREGGNRFLSWTEIRRMNALAVPSIIIQVSVFLLWFFNAQFAGSHLGAEELAAVSLANLSGNLTALSLQFGLIFALDTLMPQAMGLHEYEEVGRLCLRCAIVCMAALVPAYVAWWHMEPMLVSFGQPAAVAHLAGQFLRTYSLGLPAYVLFEIVRYGARMPSRSRVRAGT